MALFKFTTLLYNLYEQENKHLVEINLCISLIESFNVSQKNETYLGQV